MNPVFSPVKKTTLGPIINYFILAQAGFSPEMGGWFFFTAVVFSPVGHFIKESLYKAKLASHGRPARID